MTGPAFDVIGSVGGGYVTYQVSRSDFINWQSPNLSLFNSNFVNMSLSTATIYIQQTGWYDINFSISADTSSSEGSFYLVWYLVQNYTLVSQAYICGYVAYIFQDTNYTATGSCIVPLSVNDTLDLWYAPGENPQTPFNTYPSQIRSQSITVKRIL